MSSAAANQPFVFTPGASPVAATGADPLVNETRREIAEIVREVAMAVRSDRTAEEFLALLVDRILRAMAAEGVIVWQRDTSPASTYRCARRLGRITDQSIPAESIATHARMLIEVAEESQPVVVPATPGATDGDVPANPMEVPVAVVPIACEPSPSGAEYLLEVFLEPDCGVATQRGYLRFVAQMADLAGEFLRADQLRCLRRGQSLARAVDTAIAQLHDLHERKQIEPAIADAAAELFGFDRVALCTAGPPVTICAVNHVNTIDTKSPAAQQIRDAAAIELDDDQCIWFEEPPSHLEHAELRCRAVIGSASRRLVCLQLADAGPVSRECRSELIRYMHHAEIALRNVSRLDSIPGGRWIAAISPCVETSAGRTWRRILGVAVLVLLLGVIAFFPVPLVVYSPATVRPAVVQRLTAPRDAIVDEIHVHHGQEVARGQILMSMIDRDLEEQITALVGQRAVLLQQRTRSTDPRVDRSGQSHLERGLIAEQIRSIDDQLAVLEHARESLVIRAGRGGIVDAWQVDERLQSRPLRRGDPLMQVVAKDSTWVAEARVPQKRISHVQNGDANEELSVRISLDSNPNQSFGASLLKIGPAVVNKQDTMTTTAVLLRLSSDASASIASDQGAGHQSGAPARVMFHCGTTPAAYLLFQDLIRSLRGTLSLYFSSGDPVVLARETNDVH